MDDQDLILMGLEAAEADSRRRIEVNMLRIENMKKELEEEGRKITRICRLIEKVRRKPFKDLEELLHGK